MLLAQGKENQYTLVAMPLNLDLSSPDNGTNGVSKKDAWFDYDNATLNQQYVLDLVKATTGRCLSEKDAKKAHLTQQCPDGTEPSFPTQNDYLIFHIVNWGGMDKTGLTVAKQNWYVYNTDKSWDSTAFVGTRIYGKKDIWLYTIHLNRPANVVYEECSL
jgi:hypothetical protein